MGTLVSVADAGRLSAARADSATELNTQFTVAYLCRVIFLKLEQSF